MSDLCRDVEIGLSSTPKRLSSKYFYDEIGDKIFQQIMKMPEYYLTDAEAGIFSVHAEVIVGSWDMDTHRPFDLVELGAGDGSKTKILLREVLASSYHVRYVPIDISHNALDGLKKSLASELPDLQVAPLQGEYFSVLSSLSSSDRPKVVLFLGSNLGNMNDDEASSFMNQLGENLRPGDKVLLGLDQIKPKGVVLPAYNDPAGITASFNLNLLRRINRELDADFDLDQFAHRATYTEEEGIARSYLESLVNQSVRIAVLDRVFHFAKGERIHVEISRKYNDKVLENVISTSSLVIRDKFVDSKSYFADYLLVKE